jgi:subtilisin family serine protease
VIAALDWIHPNANENGAKVPVHVVNLPLGHPVVESAADDPLVQAVETLWKNDAIVLVCSAGNDGRDGYGTITRPGNSSLVITVGSVTHWGLARSPEGFVPNTGLRIPVPRFLYRFQRNTR